MRGPRRSQEVLRGTPIYRVTLLGAHCIYAYMHLPVWPKRAPELTNIGPILSNIGPILDLPFRGIGVMQCITPMHHLSIGMSLNRGGPIYPF